LKKVWYKVTLCENCQQQSCKAHWPIYLSKMIGERRPLIRESLADTDPPPFKTSIFNLFLLVAPRP